MEQNPTVIKLQCPTDPNVIFTQEAEADGVHNYKIHTSETSEMETISEGVTRTTIITIITKTAGGFQRY